MDAVTPIEGTKVDSVKPDASVPAGNSPAPQSEATNVANNAVAVELTTVSSLQNTREAEGSSRRVESPISSAEEAEKLAEKIASQLSGTSVKFDVTAMATDGEMNFQVVDEATGKVLREFPPEGLPDALKEANEEGGVLVDGEA